MLLHLYWLALQLDWRVAIARVGVMSEDWQGCVTCRLFRLTHRHLYWRSDSDGKKRSAVASPVDLCTCICEDEDH